jgi:hypothetical protein
VTRGSRSLAPCGCEEPSTKVSLPATTGAPCKATSRVDLAERADLTCVTCACLFRACLRACVMGDRHLHVSPSLLIAHPGCAESLSSYLTIFFGKSSRSLSWFNCELASRCDWYRFEVRLGGLFETDIHYSRPYNMLRLQRLSRSYVLVGIDTSK